ncbi:hypothetical protein [Antrihabitans cavernicola]|uniref:Uncharacterized protein n=1 Tax=Antrihabitans cavernicola TaxID=2495913 RepID=A0A5A7SIA0_9NOCA|nr:hypothetical protein [Spelaeibacter cavernicola]KAA0024912.1 hypothetical protein FOY51_03030 [Spelaeibacter cavernicola]
MHEPMGATESGVVQISAQSASWRLRWADVRVLRAVALCTTAVIACCFVSSCTNNRQPARTMAQSSSLAGAATTSPVAIASASSPCVLTPNQVAAIVQPVTAVTLDNSEYINKGKESAAENCTYAWLPPNNNGEQEHFDLSRYAYVDNKKTTSMAKLQDNYVESTYGGSSPTEVYTSVAATLNTLQVSSVLHPDIGKGLVTSGSDSFYLAGPGKYWYECDLSLYDDEAKLLALAEAVAASDS